VKRTISALVWRNYDPNRLTKEEEAGLELDIDAVLPEKVILNVLEYTEK